MLARPETRRRPAARGPRAAVRLAALLCLGASLGPVAAKAAEVNLPVPNAVIYPGQPVLDKGVSSMRFKVPAERLGDYVVEKGMLGDKLARRTLLPGKPILFSDLKSPDLVRAGVPAPIVYSEPGLTIQGIGIPLASAAEGALVRVRNADSGIVISGIVRADGAIGVLAE